MGERFWLVIYFLVKLIFYSAWCQRGKMNLTGKTTHLHPLILGMIRLVMGVAFGAAILGLSMVVVLFFGESRLYHHYQGVSFFIYLLVYAPIRWVEWWIMEKIIVRPGSSFVSPYPLAQRWRVGGIIISCLVDISHVMLFEGLFLGRIAC